MDFEEKVIDSIQLSGAALVKFEKQATEIAARDARIASQAPTVVDELLKAGMIELHEKDDAIRALSNPEQVLELLKSAAQYVRSAATAPGTGGVPVDKNGRQLNHIKKASVNGDGGGYLGKRGAPSAAWDGFNAALGIQ